ncbi:MAG: glycerophosphodiester phosphodiesterase [Planctomycetia bacterium]|nr:glycerophosphodiester phosphodiesterase [Planctomycetia bacterium]
MSQFSLAWAAFACLSASAVARADGAPSDRKLVIAHRGASGYLSEHTLPAYALAYGLGADYIEPDVVLSRDGVLVCHHDIHLGQTTDVAHRFPDRARPDGKFYCIDFTLAELKTLQAKGRNDPLEPGYQLATLDELLTMVQRLNERSGRAVGTIPEPKSPAWHREQGQPIEPKLLAAYAARGLSRRGDPVIVQCFELESLRRMRHELKSDLKLVYLTGDSLDDATLDELAKFADGIGPSAKLIENDGRPVDGNSLVRRAHERGLKVYPYTFGKDEAPARRFYWNYGVDGLFSDFPDVAVRAAKGK